jgi:hypothetical protein
MSTLETTTPRNVIRPLRIIAAEIRECFDAGDAAAASASEPHYRKAAPLLAEAKRDHFKDDMAGFLKWGMNTFGKSRTQISTWHAFGIQSEHKSFKNLHEFELTPKKKGGLGQPYRGVTREWAAPVSDVAGRARQEAFRLAQQDSLTRTQEREAERKLANRLIDIGYKVLAKELHPDKMHGDKEAMQRLVRVRDKLKHCI